MEAKPKGEHSTLQALSETPPDQWATLLQVLGASFRPVDDEKGGDEAPCTVTSLLGLMDQGDQQQQSVAPAAKAFPSGPTPGPAKAAARRGKPRAAPSEKAAPAQAEEDTRDLEELLRSLGEAPTSDPSATKAKRKAKAAAKRPKEAAPPPPAPEPLPVAATPAPRSPRPRLGGVPVEVPAEEEVEAPAPEPEVDAEAWQTVASRAARRGGQRAQEPIRSPPEAQHVQEEPTRSSPEAQAAQEETEDRATEEALPQAAARLEAAPEAAAAAIAEPATASEATVESLEESNGTDVYDPLHRRRPRRSLSEGCRPQADFDSEAEGSDVEDARQFQYVPSVATWLSRPWSLQRPPTDGGPGPLPEGAVRGRSCSREEKAPDPVGAEAASWHARPSVATWLRSPTATPQGALRAASREMQLWPATPEDTPPGSPRGRSDSGNQQVVWMPIPSHLLAEVQQLLGAGSLAAAAAAAAAGPQVAPVTR